jgi:hypothetical protein
MALVFIFLCVGLMAIFCGVAFPPPVFLSIGVYFVIPHSWCGVSRLLMEFLGVPPPPASSSSCFQDTLCSRFNILCCGFAGCRLTEESSYNSSRL